MELKEVCTKCGESKSIDLFPKRGIGKRRQCNLCRSKYVTEWAKSHKEKRKIYQKRWNDKNKERIKEVGRIYAAKWREENPDKYKAQFHKGRCQKYGVTPEWYAQKLTEQGRVCGICGKTCNSGRPLGIDHDHVTGKARGLLCGRCNSSLARFEEIDGWEQKAVAYLREHGVDV